MAIELKTPEVGESITEVEIGAWLVAEGAFVKQDEPVVEIESEKATIELPSPASGKLTQILKQTGEAVAVGEIIGYIEEAEADDAPDASTSQPPVAAKPEKEDAPPSTSPKPAPAPAKPASDETRPKSATSGPEAPKPKPAREAAPAPKPSDGAHQSRPAAQAPASEPKKAPTPAPQRPAPDGDARIMPAARRLIAETGLDPADIEPTGPGGRILKEDVQRFIEQRLRGEAPTETNPHRNERIVRMSPMRRTIAARLLAAQRNAALLTTFNEIDMSAVKTMRADLQETFQERYGVKLGYMSFFAKACVHALRECPELNARVDEEDIVYHDYCDIGIAVGSGKGLVVPVLRNVERMSFADIESAIADFAARAQANRIKLEELAGGTFTISNGGVYGSLLSTPIINPPQSGVLGMHAIQDRPVAVDGQVVIRPMMYVALTYDHRIVDGREAVTFLKNIKARIEKPALLLDF